MSALRSQLCDVLRMHEVEDDEIHLGMAVLVSRKKKRLYLLI